MTVILSCPDVTNATKEVSKHIGKGSIFSSSTKARYDCLLLTALGNQRVTKEEAITVVERQSVGSLAQSVSE